MFDLPLEKVREAVVFMIALVLSIAVHEFGHAIAADKLGDRTPRYQGRVTLNPLAHADPFGTFLFPLISFFINPSMLFGWGKPVIINPLSFTRRFRMKTSHLLVAIAGPTMNVLLAILVSIILMVLLATHAISTDSPLTHGIIQVMMLNWVLAFFNLIPCPPLDGGAVLAGLLPDRFDHINRFLQQYGFMILLGLLVTGATRIFLMPAMMFAQLTLELIVRIAL